MKLKYTTHIPNYLAMGGLILAQTSICLHADEKPKRPENPIRKIIPKKEPAQPAQKNKQIQPKRVSPTPAQAQKKSADRPKPNKIDTPSRPNTPQAQSASSQKAAQVKYQQLIKEDPHLAKEFPLEKFLEIEMATQKNLLDLKRGGIRKYRPERSKSDCGNGNFESRRINAHEWTGGFGQVHPYNHPNAGQLKTPLFAGLRGGPLASGNSHHTIVPNAQEPSLTDPMCGIPVKHGGKHALRLGNRVPGYGGELISKTFKVSPNNKVINFWYACVLQNPHNHSLAAQPGFEVKVLDEQGQIIPNVTDLGGGLSKIKADRTNPFFQYNGRVVYKNWDCATINLTGHENKWVTVQFINVDCGKGGHWGYTYIDDFCSSCKGADTGSISLVTNKTKCPSGTKAGIVIVDYTVPKVKSSTGAITATGTAKLHLEVLQDSSVVYTSPTSPTRTADGEYGFTLPPCGARYANLDSTKGYDYVVVAEFEINGVSLTQRTTGLKPDGQIAGINNDCLCKKPVVIDPCCPDFKKLTSMWNHSGSSSYSINMDLNNNSAILNQIQAYVTYLKSLDPSVSRLTLTWQLYRGGTSTTYTSGTHVPPAITKHFVAGGTGLVGGAPSFSGLLMGNVYRVELTVTLIHNGSSDVSVSLPKTCPKKVSSDYYWIQSRSAKAKGGLLIDGKPAPANLRNR